MRPDFGSGARRSTLLPGPSASIGDLSVRFGAKEQVK